MPLWGLLRMYLLALFFLLCLAHLLVLIEGSHFLSRIFFTFFGMLWSSSFLSCLLVSLPLSQWLCLLLTCKSFYFERIYCTIFVHIPLFCIFPFFGYKSRLMLLCFVSFQFWVEILVNGILHGFMLVTLSCLAYFIFFFFCVLEVCPSQYLFKLYSSFYFL